MPLILTNIYTKAEEVGERLKKQLNQIKDTDDHYFLFLSLIDEIVNLKIAVLKLEVKLEEQAKHEKNN